MPTFTASVNASSDDAQESSGTMNLTGTALNANATTQISGMRFTGVTIPPGSSIETATLELYLSSGQYDDPDVTIYGQAADDAATFTTTTNDISSRPSTTAAVVWTESGIGTGARSTPDLASVVGEIVGRAGWASGNALVVFIQGNSSSSALRWAAEDGASASAVLSVTYSTSTGITLKADHYRKLLTQP